MTIKIKEIEGIKVDNDYMQGTVEEIEVIINYLQDMCSVLSNKDEDLFRRFTAFNILRTILVTTIANLKAARFSFVRGHMVHHPLLQTQLAKENGWDSIDLDKEPFFTSPSQANDARNVVSELLKFVAQRDISKVENQEDEQDIKH